jgi:hypothetical protein
VGDVVAGDAGAAGAEAADAVGDAGAGALTVDEEFAGFTTAACVPDALEQPASSPTAAKATVRAANQVSLPGTRSARCLGLLCLDGSRKDLFIFPP